MTLIKNIARAVILGAVAGASYFAGRYSSQIDSAGEIINAERNQPSFLDLFETDFELGNYDRYLEGLKEGQKIGFEEGYVRRKIEEFVERESETEFYRRYPVLEGPLPDAELSKITRWHNAFVLGEYDKTDDVLRRLAEEGAKYRKEIFPIANKIISNRQNN